MNLLTKEGKLNYRRALLRDLREEFSEEEIKELRQVAVEEYNAVIIESAGILTVLAEEYKKEMIVGSLGKAERLLNHYFKQLKLFSEYIVEAMSYVEAKEMAQAVFSEEMRKSVDVIRDTIKRFK